MLFMFYHSRLISNKKKWQICGFQVSQYIKGGTKTAGSFHYDALFELGKGAEKKLEKLSPFAQRGGEKSETSILENYFFSERVESF